MIDDSTPFAISTAPKRDSRHWEQSTTTWGELRASLSSPGKKKESGNYLLGTLRPTTVQHKTRSGEKDGPPCEDLHRRKDAVVSRSAITLDVDHPVPGFHDLVEMLLPWATLMHTTFSSTPDALRYRIIIPTSRELAPDEYIVASEAIMQRFEPGQFDTGSSEPERYMFRPAAQQPDWYQQWEFDGPPADVEELLESFEKDLSGKPMPTPSRTKRDPFEIDGVIGAFNRAYADWDLLIETYDLPYDKVADDRYQLVGASSEAGMGPVAGVSGFVYSHHANDPAHGKTCSAFDLVRLHRFGDLDEGTKPQTPVNKLPSNEAMIEMATYDHRVTAELVGLDFDQVTDEEGNLDEEAPGAWMLGLNKTRAGKVIDSVQNRDLIRDHDPLFTSLHFNELSLSPETSADELPWRRVTDRSRIFSDTDRAELMDYLERKYGLLTSKARVDALVDTTAGRNHINPVRDYLESLVWDGNPRVELCLPGVRPTDFTKTVARKVMVAAVARMLDPGCKWDHTLVLYGTEGLGKSGWIDRMSKGHSSSLGRIDNKDTLLAMQRSWIMTADEGHSLRKSDSDALKEFLTRTADVFRMPFDRETLVHPRHCVIWSTTNDETFLRRQEGNRRFLIVHCQDKVDFEAMTEAYVDQVWAEAVQLYRAGELLYLTDEESIEASQERERFVEEDSLAGIIQEYLDRLVPMDWWNRSPEARVSWIEDRSQGWEPEGDITIDRVCSRQIWREALGQRHEPRRTDLLDITEALKRVPGWVAADRQRIPGYGPQLTFIREDFL